MNEIYKLYEDCSNWLNGDDTNTAKELVERAVDVLAEDNEFNDIWSKCVFHINNWNNSSIEEQCEQAEELVEDLSACLGEYLQ